MPYLSSQPYGPTTSAVVKWGFISPLVVFGIASTSFKFSVAKISVTQTLICY